MTESGLPYPKAVSSWYLREQELAINPLKILFVASEVEGLVKTGGLADVAKALPQHLARQGHDVRIIMPFYKTIKRRDEATLLASRWLPTPRIAVISAIASISWNWTGSASICSIARTISTAPSSMPRTTRPIPTTVNALPF